VVSKSQIEQLLDVLEQCEPGSIPQVVVAPKVGLQAATETKLSQDDTVGGTPLQCRPVTHSQSMSGEEAEELFAICDDIRQLVGDPIDAIVDTLTGAEDSKDEKDLVDAVSNTIPMGDESIEVLDSSTTDNVTKLADEMNFLNGVFGNGDNLFSCPPSPVSSSGSSPSSHSFDNLDALLTSSSDAMFSSDDDSLFGNIDSSFPGNKFVDDRFDDLFPSLLSV